MAEVDRIIQATVDTIRENGSMEDLSIADSAIQASCIVDHLSRAVDQREISFLKKKIFPRNYRRCRC
jgi:hypothetical protein